jgi:hypothetical protein
MRCDGEAVGASPDNHYMALAHSSSPLKWVTGEPDDFGHCGLASGRKKEFRIITTAIRSGFTVFSLSAAGLASL